MRFVFLLFMLLTLAAQVFVSRRVWLLLPLSAPLRWVVVALLAMAFVSFFVLMSADSPRLPLWLAKGLYQTGTSWLVMLLYLTMLFALLLLGRALGLVPTSWLRDSWQGTALVVGVMMVVFVAANAQYRHKVRVPLTLDSGARVERPLKLVMLSDLHLGYHNSRAELSRWIDMLNAEQPDAVLIAGDIIDISVRPLLEEDMATEWHRLQAPVYACLGNHEYYSSEPLAARFYEAAGIRLLRDEAVHLAHGLTVVGRDDRTNLRRKPLERILADVDTTNRYVLVLDHQPYNLEQAQRCGVAFQFSGHTHYGQVWPINWITRAMYECAYGSWQRGNTRYYVSSGMGIWGGKFRIGTQSEYVVATLMP